MSASQLPDPMWRRRRRNPRRPIRARPRQARRPTSSGQRGRTGRRGPRVRHPPSPGRPPRGPESGRHVPEPRPAGESLTSRSPSRPPPRRSVHRPCPLRHPRNAPNSAGARRRLPTTPQGCASPARRVRISTCLAFSPHPPPPRSRPLPWHRRRRSPAPKKRCFQPHWLQFLSQAPRWHRRRHRAVRARPAGVRRRRHLARR